jgi:hypothetical protein
MRSVYCLLAPRMWHDCTHACRPSISGSKIYPERHRTSTSSRHCHSRIRNGLPTHQKHGGTNGNPVVNARHCFSMINVVLSRIDAHSVCVVATKAFMSHSCTTCWHIAVAIIWLRGYLWCALVMTPLVKPSKNKVVEASSKSRLSRQQYQLLASALGLDDPPSQIFMETFTSALSYNRRIVAGHSSARLIANEGTPPAMGLVKAVLRLEADNGLWVVLIQPYQCQLARNEHGLLTLESLDLCSHSNYYMLHPNRCHLQCMHPIQLDGGHGWHVVFD